MTSVEEIISQMRDNPRGVRFADLCRACEHFFGQPRQKGTSHRVYRTPWLGDPRVNIQDDKEKAKVYQVRQVLKAMERWEYENRAR